MAVADRWVNKAMQQTTIQQRSKSPSLVMPMAPQLLTDQHPTASAAPSAAPSVDISHLVLEDDKPVDNFQSAQQQRFLVQTLYDSQALPMPFLAEATFAQIVGFVLVNKCRKRIYYVAV